MPSSSRASSGNPFRPLTTDKLAAYSRFLHNKAPPNLFIKEKIPWKTILIALVFFFFGTIFVIWGAHETVEKGFSTSYEKLLLGAILFIPGSYHSLLAVMACKKTEGWNYDDLAAFESDDFHDKD